MGAYELFTLFFPRLSHTTESLLLEIVRHYHELMIKIVTLSLRRKAILWTEEF